MVKLFCFLCQEKVKQEKSPKTLHIDYLLNSGLNDMETGKATETLLMSSF